MKQCFWLLVSLLSVINAGCGQHDTNTGTGTGTIENIIRTTSAPVDALTRDIVKDLVPIELLCPVSEDPSTWRPTPEVVSRYQRARLIISNGAGLEDWVRTAPLPRSRVIEASSAINDQLIIVQGEAHSHGPAGSHSHETVLSTVWLDPVHAISQAEVITSALIKTFPEYKSEFKTNLKSLTENLLSLHERLKSIDVSKLTIIAPLKPYGYIAKRYQWNENDIGEKLENWPMEIHSIAMSRGEFVDTPTLILCEELPSPKVADTHLRANNIYAVQWKTTPSEIDGTFVEFLSNNVKNLEYSINNIDN